MNFSVDKVIANRFELRERLYEGPLSRVWAAWDRERNAEVAFKMILEVPKHRVERLWHEAMLWASVRHPHVVPVLDCGWEDSRPYLVMEKIHGPSLERRLASGPLPVKECLSLAHQALEGLGAAHEAGLLHLDVNPGNFLLEPVGENMKEGFSLKIIDFGLAQIASPHLKNAPDAVNSIVGSAAYLAPEQWNLGVLDARTDLYALGCVLYESLAGRVPFEDATTAALLEAHLHRPPPSLRAVRPEVGPRLEAWIFRLLEKEPSKRPANACEALQGLDAARAAVLG